MGLLDSVKSPNDLRRMDLAQLDQLADEIRAFLVEQVATTGGHLSPTSAWLS